MREWQVQERVFPFCSLHSLSQQASEHRANSENCRGSSSSCASPAYQSAIRALTRRGSAAPRRRGPGRWRLSAKLPLPPPLPGPWPSLQLLVAGAAVSKPLSTPASSAGGSWAHTTPAHARSNSSSHPPAGRPGARSSTSLSLNFLLCKMGAVTVPTDQAPGKTW